mmetsp:Transcript_11346/g.8942  ORF Transcript_11346/g.8942 Transcript_11346/m.8942 type:complete len:83 (+) Transcript_11346:57-305(+)
MPRRACGNGAQACACRVFRKCLVAPSGHAGQREREEREERREGGGHAWRCADDVPPVLRDLLALDKTQLEPKWLRTPRYVTA